MYNPNYTISHLIGSGGQGNVYLAYSHKDKKNVCIKKVYKKNGDESRGVTYLNRLKHPGFVQTLDVFEDGEFYYHVMTYIEGTSLSALRKKCTNKKATCIARQLMEMIDELNRHQLTYNDLKPDNIILTHNNMVHLIDVGAILAQEDVTSVRYGSLQFCSPEYVKKEKVTWASDLFSVGKTLDYICNHPNKILKKWILKATRSQCSCRFCSVYEAYEALYPRGKLSVIVFLLLFVLLFSGIALSDNKWVHLHPQELNQTEDLLIFHYFNLANRLNEAQRLELSNQLIESNDRLCWLVQAQLCQKSNHSSLRRRHKILEKKQLSTKGLSEEDICFLLNRLFSLHDEKSLRIVYEDLISRESLSLSLQYYLVEVAFYLANEEALINDFKNCDAQVRALCFYKLFLLGHYQEGYLHKAMQLLKAYEHHPLIKDIQYGIAQWGERS